MSSLVIDEATRSRRRQTRPREQINKKWRNEKKKNKKKWKRKAAGPGWNGGGWLPLLPHPLAHPPVSPAASRRPPRRRRRQHRQLLLRVPFFRGFQCRRAGRWRIELNTSTKRLGNGSSNSKRNGRRRRRFDAVLFGLFSFPFVVCRWLETEDVFHRQVVAA